MRIYRQIISLKRKVAVPHAFLSALSERLWTVALFVLTIVAVTGQSSSSSAHQPKRVKRLNEIIQHIELTDGSETIGGSSMQDAVSLLRERTSFPVALETIEFENPKDFVTLGEALSKLQTLKTRGKLAARDQSRLDAYEKLAVTKDQSEPMVPRQRTFTLVQDHISVRELLDQLVQLDNEYVWTNYGTDGRPLIVIQPRAGSALDWSISGICTPRPIASAVLYAGCNGQPCGQFTKELNAHNITMMRVLKGPVSPGQRPPDPLPDVQVDLCSHHLTARDVLIRTVQGTHISWTLAGVKGMRFISFEP